MIMAFGAGALICAVAYELVFEVVRMARGSGVPALKVVSISSAITAVTIKEAPAITTVSPVSKVVAVTQAFMFGPVLLHCFNIQQVSLFTFRCK
jgi:hypothetical protein